MTTNRTDGKKKIRKKKHTHTLGMENLLLGVKWVYEIFVTFCFVLFFFVFFFFFFLGKKILGHDGSENGGFFPT